MVDKPDRGEGRLLSHSPIEMQQQEQRQPAATAVLSKEVGMRDLQRIAADLQWRIQEACSKRAREESAQLEELRAELREKDRQIGELKDTVGKQAREIDWLNDAVKLEEKRKAAIEKAKQHAEEKMAEYSIKLRTTEIQLKQTRQRRWSSGGTAAAAVAAAAPSRTIAMIPPSDLAHIVPMMVAPEQQGIGAAQDVALPTGTVGTTVAQPDQVHGGTSSMFLARLMRSGRAVALKVLKDVALSHFLSREWVAYTELRKKYGADRMAQHFVEVVGLSFVYSEAPQHFASERDHGTPLRMNPGTTLYGRAHWWPCLVMEHSTLGTLRRVMDRTQDPARAPNLMDRLLVALRIATSLEMLHECCVVHGDLGIDNVLLVLRGSWQRVVMSDLSHAYVTGLWDHRAEGSARRLGGPGANDNGFARWPLVAEPRGTRSDMFALGVLLNQVLAWSPKLQNVYDDNRVVLDQRCQAMDELRATCNGPRLLLRLEECLRTDRPDLRPDAKMMVQALEIALRGIHVKDPHERVLHLHVV